MNADITNPDGCNRCFPCVVPADCGCWCHLPDDAPPDRLQWQPDDVIVERSPYHVVVRRAGSSKLAETVAEFAEAAAQSGQTPDQLLDELLEKDQLTDAPASLTDELVRRGVIKEAT
jgi:hypothetical protein